MSKKPAKKNDSLRKQDDTAFWVKMLMTVSLVPMVAGILFIGAWAMDIIFWKDEQAQMIVGFLFILISFASSNALQKKWRLAAGWTLLAVSDLIVLLWMNVTVQIIALSVGAVGLLIIILEFIRQWKVKPKN